MPVFARSVLIDAPVHDVFRFHERPDALALLSPAFPPVRMTGRSGSGIEAGSRVELRVGPFRWVAQHTIYEKNRLFVDEQIRGPFAKWVHRHEFEAVGNQTRLTDRIEYELPGGWLVNALFGWTATLGLRNMFSHRHRVTREAVRP
ncbi:MAG: SRPBCC family protein [Bryobacteraceae bacterium]|nr:SRPBCC family protein [Bryobacteraceae bacterium]